MEFLIKFVFGFEPVVQAVTANVPTVLVVNPIGADLDFIERRVNRAYGLFPDVLWIPRWNFI